MPTPSPKFFYTVTSVEDVYDLFEVKKHVIDENEDVVATYCVNIGDDYEFCDCMGFRSQSKRPLREHKHVQLVISYISNGQPDNARYLINKDWSNSPYKPEEDT